jgi:hypothetical protein
VSVEIIYNNWHIQASYQTQPSMGYGTLENVSYEVQSTINQDCAK